FLYHAGMVFVIWDWHVKNDVLYGGFLKYSMTFLHTWRMPLLFMISGAGTYYAVRKITPSAYLGERTRRLFVPLLAGIFLLVPVQVYIEKIAGYSSLRDFYKHMFEGIYPEGNFSWHHLWFIAYLYFLALLITPFLNMLRSKKISGLADRLAEPLTKPMGLNLVIIPLFLSQLILRNYFETERNDLVNDWASICHYSIFFMTGFLFLTQKKVAAAMSGYRRLYLAETIIFTAIMFAGPSLVRDERTGEIIFDVAEIIISWTCSVAAAGYARKYLSFDSPFRKSANEAIYPFYLLHQPLIVVTGYFVTSLQVADIIKALIIILQSLILFILIYNSLIRPFNSMRVIFGMKISRVDSTLPLNMTRPSGEGSDERRA
ncbi:MAG: acyltransferase family protein, partial [Bacteroidales bacterium]|nr:acyltransferase family protein [Bacteroidales bacterium]